MAAAEGSIQGFAELVKADGTVSKTDGLGATLGINWLHDDHLNPFQLASGHEPATDDEVVLDQATAQREGWALGDQVTVLTHDVPRPLTLVGTATFGAVSGLPGSSVVAVNDQTAQALFAEPGRTTPSWSAPPAPSTTPRSRTASTRPWARVATT